MKKIVKQIFFFSLLVAVTASCKKDEIKSYFEGGTAPVLTASSTTALVLQMANKANNAISFNWTNPNYQFSSGTSSQSVSYTLQIDTTGANFTNPNISETSISQDLGTTLTVGQLNGKLLSMGLAFGAAHNIEVRIKASIVNSVDVLYSNVIKFVATPYLDFAVTPPGTASNNYSDGTLYLVGSAPASPNNNWSNPAPASLKFTRSSATLYTLTTSLIGGAQYLAIPVNGSWNTKYGNSCGSDGCNSPSSFSFQMGGNNIAAPAGSGTYTITVNFITGKITVQ